MNPIGVLQGLHGELLVGGICLLLFLEEVGIPLPFAPGDLLLAIAGIAIAAGRVDPVSMVGIALVTIIAGAMAGREIFALLGWERLMRVASRLHAGRPLERAAGMLRRSGWRAVFTARLVPGLRVHTTQVAGVSGMPRLQFLGGLAPSAAVYVGSFIGLGAAFGRPVLALIHEAEHQALIAILTLITIVVAFFLLRKPAKRMVASLAAGGFESPLKLSLDSPGLILIPACIGLNFTGHAIVVGLKLPLFLDSIGTVLCALVAGPWVGGSVGFVTNLITSNTVDPIAAPYSIVSFAVGFAAGMSRHLNWPRRMSGRLALWLTCFAIASLLSTPLNLLFYGGSTGVSLGDQVYGSLLNAHLPRLIAAYIGEASIDLPDKLITVAAALFIVQGLPARESRPSGMALDLREAFTYVFRSPRWLRRLLAAALCVLFFWLIIPGLLFAGYTAAVARSVQAGDAQLPAWGRLPGMARDGLIVILILIVWNLPGALLSVPGSIISDAVQTHEAPAFMTRWANVLTALGGVWSLLFALVQAAVWSQYLRGGFKAAVNVGQVIRRLRFNVALTIVVGALLTVLSVLGTIGVVGLVVGLLLTLPYASWVGAYLSAQYGRLTDAAVAS